MLLVPCNPEFNFTCTLLVSRTPKYLKYSTFCDCFWSVITCNVDGCLEILITLVFSPHLFPFHTVTEHIVQKDSKWIPFYHDKPEAGEGLQTWRVTANKLNKQSRTDDKALFSWLVKAGRLPLFQSKRKRVVRSTLYTRSYKVWTWGRNLRGYIEGRRCLSENWTNILRRILW